MILRCLNLFRKGSVYIKSIRHSSHSHGAIDGAGWQYRSNFHPNRAQLLRAQLLGSFMWWWIFWHIWHQPDHLFGEFPWPHVTDWTDEELGIPPDDAD